MKNFSDTLAIVFTLSLGLAKLSANGLINNAEGVHDYMKQNRVPHVWHVDGNSHDAPEWRAALYHFSQRLFR